MTAAFWFTLSVALAALIHEAGHLAAARWYGYSLRFYLGWGRFLGLPVPRGLWDMPVQASARERRIIAAAGFICEFAAIPAPLLFGLWQYPVIALLHLALYPYYAGTSSDFRYFF